MTSPRLISIVCPVFNEEQTVPLFYQRISAVMERLSLRYQFELIFTNNCSTDRTREIIVDLALKDPRVKLVTLSRNFGYQSSVLSGLSVSTGDAVTVIDVDCEDPPEMLGAFLEKFEEGYDLVYGIRHGRPEPRAVVLLRKTFYRLMRAVADFEVYLDMAEFCLMSKRLKDQILANKNTFPFIRSELAYSGFRKYGIRYDRQQRVGGVSHYNLFSMAVFGAAGILTSSTFAFRFAAYFFPTLLLLNLSGILAMIISNGDTWFRALLLFNATYIVTLLTLHGLYIARIYKNGISRPVFIIDYERSILSDCTTIVEAGK